MEKATLRAPNISCGHCVMAIKRAVGQIDGVSAVDGDPASKTVTVSYDAARVSMAQIEQAMAGEGYPVAK